MTTRTIVRAVVRGSLRDIHHVTAVPPNRAGGEVARVYARAEREFGVLAPPLALHSSAPEPLAACWLLLSRTLLTEGRVGRAVKEAVATEVSRANSCPYCVDIHQAAVDTLPRPTPDTPGAEAAAWLRSGAGQGEPAPFGAGETAEIIGVALTFHYLNRMVNVFLDDSPVPAPAALRGPILRAVARTMRPAGGSLDTDADDDLLPGAPLPSELRWAKAAPAVADALARSVAAVEHAARWVPHPVRALLTDRLADDGEGAPGPGRARLEAALAGLREPDHRAIGRIALLTAFSAQQLTGADVAAFREHHPDDRELVELTSWAALRTAVVVAGRLAAPPPRIRHPKPSSDPLSC
ncbi:carboxymuconolactone decarboxylase family protein [Streptomyces alkaliphilus]|uniref:carboxymuconolactone decarboxylase family protein n=1 Tax=Streptomyces alkaliphilus TaxID=1472722 RepID=UPI001180520A|nr:carboxymuconolactone decarboxylase family protein [Streptomyces alkaliphilus]MQS06132.1 alkylhydroperoxidase [Streptomyces alkaliphilus]